MCRKFSIESTSFDFYPTADPKQPIYRLGLTKFWYCVKFILNLKWNYGDNKLLEYKSNKYIHLIIFKYSRVKENILADKKM